MFWSTSLGIIQVLPKLIQYLCLSLNQKFYFEEFKHECQHVVQTRKKIIVYLIES